MSMEKTSRHVVSVHPKLNSRGLLALQTLNPWSHFLHPLLLWFRGSTTTSPSPLFFLAAYLPNLDLMAFRGRGRGRGRGGGFERPPNFTPYENFPDMERLPNLVDILHSSQETRVNALRKSQLEEFWRGSCYYLQEDASRTKKELGTRRILGKKPKTQERREALGNYLKLNPSNFPVELIQGSRRVQQISKKLKWDRHADQLSFDSFEKLEEKHKDKDENVEKKQDEDEDEEPQEEAEEESSDDDYNQNIDFDDDEDDMNMEEDAEEDVYD